MEEKIHVQLNSKRFIRIHLIDTMRFEPEVMYRVLQRATTHISRVKGHRPIEDKVKFIGQLDERNRSPKNVIH